MNDLGLPCQAAFENECAERARVHVVAGIERKRVEHWPFRRRSMRDSVDDFTSGTYGKQRPTQRPTES